MESIDSNSDKGTHRASRFGVITNKTVRRNPHKLQERDDDGGGYKKSS